MVKKCLKFSLLVVLINLAQFVCASSRLGSTTIVGITLGGIGCAKRDNCLSVRIPSGMSTRGFCAQIGGTIGVDYQLLYLGELIDKNSKNCFLRQYPMANARTLTLVLKAPTVISEGWDFTVLPE